MVMITFNLVAFLNINPANAQLNPICHLLALSVVHHIIHVSRVRANVSLFFIWPICVFIAGFGG
jgi:hypothetical protein